MRKPVVLRPGERASERDSFEDHLYRNADGESYWYRAVGRGEACLTGYSSQAARAEIPERLDGHPLVAFDAGTFSDLPWLETVVCPGTLRRIEDYAFSRCARLSAVELNEGLESIGHAAFHLCSGLSRVRVPASLRHVGNHPFGDEVHRNGGSGIGRLEIPPSNPHVRFDEPGALYERCGAGWRLVDGSAVEEAEFAPLPGTVEVGDSAFLGNGRIRAFHANPELRRIRRDAFRACGKLVSAEFPDALEGIETGAFSCSGLRSLCLPANCTELGTDALCTGPVFKGSNGRFYSTKLAAVEVEAGNPVYRSTGGALFCRGRNGSPDELLLCPKAPERLDLAGIRRAAPGSLAGTDHVGELVVDEGLAGYGDVHFSCDRVRLGFSRTRDGAAGVALELPGGKWGFEPVARLFACSGLDVDAFLAAYDETLLELLDHDKIEAARVMACRCANPCGLDEAHGGAFRGFLSANIESACAHFGARGYWRGFDELQSAGLLNVGNVGRVADVLARCCGSLAVAYVLQMERRAVPQERRTLESRIGDAYAL